MRIDREAEKLMTVHSSLMHGNVHDVGSRLLTSIKGQVACTQNVYGVHRLICREIPA